MTCNIQECSVTLIYSARFLRSSTITGLSATTNAHTGQYTPQTGKWQEGVFPPAVDFAVHSQAAPSPAAVKQSVPGTCAAWPASLIPASEQLAVRLALLCPCPPLPCHVLLPLAAPPGQTAPASEHCWYGAPEPEPESK